MASNLAGDGCLRCSDLSEVLSWSCDCRVKKVLEDAKGSKGMYSNFDIGKQYL